MWFLRFDEGVKHLQYAYRFQYNAYVMFGCRIGEQGVKTHQMMVAQL
jgi:hypothetical protein